MRKVSVPGLVLGLLVTGLGIWLLWERVVFWGESVSVAGEVVELVASRGTGDSTTWGPRIRFRSLDGADVTFTENAFSNPPAYRVGQRVTVRYRQDNPYDARLDDFFSHWFHPLLLLALGLGIGLLSRRVGLRSGGVSLPFPPERLIRPRADRYRTARLNGVGGGFFASLLLLVAAQMWANQRMTAFFLLGCIGLILLFGRPSLRLLLEVRRTGWPVLLRQPGSMRLGETVSARLYLPRLPQGKHLRVALVCLQARKTLSPELLRRMVRSGESLDSPFVQEVWGQEIQVFTRTSDCQGFSSMALLEWSLPADGHPSETDNPRERWYWECRLLGVEGRETCAIRFPLTVER